MNRLRALIVEDDPFTRSMIVTTLQMQGIDVVIESGSASQAIRAARILKPNLAILDLDLGAGPSGIDLALGLRRFIPNVGIIMLTTFEDPRLHSAGLPNLPAGSAYLVKREVNDIDLLFKAIEKTLELSQTLSEFESKSLSIPTLVNLTDSQIETMRLIAKGLSNLEIAKKRNINEKSVEQTISRLAKQLGIENSPQSNQRVQISRQFFKLTGARFPEDE